MKALAISLLLLLPWALGCSKEGSGGTTYPVYQDGPATPGTDPGAAPIDRGFDPGQGGPPVDTGQKVDFGSQKDVPPMSLDEGPPKSIDLACGKNLKTSTGTKKMGEPCTDHSECKTGYCYDEWYLGWTGGFRFCTAACNGCPTGQSQLCSSFDEPDPGIKHTCIIFTSCHANEFGAFDVQGICVPKCNNNFQHCTNWYESTYSECSVPRVGSCGTIGASGTCFVPKQ